jgi:hypothetical protein
VTGKNRIMIYGPKDDGTYVVEFMTADGDVLSISIPRSETPCNSTFPGADALWAVRAGCCCRIRGPLAHQRAALSHPEAPTRLQGGTPFAAAMWLSKK